MRLQSAFRSLRGRGVLVVSVAIAVVLACAFAWHSIRANPNIAFLAPEGGASWIGFDRPFSVGAHSEFDVRTSFRRSLTIDEVPPNGILTVHALRTASVSLDGREIAPQRRRLDQWQSPLRIPLGEQLQPGAHELVIVVDNRLGPAVMLAHCPELHLVTDNRWEASADGHNWTPARELTDRERFEDSNDLMPTYQALGKQMPFLLPLAIGVFALAVFGIPRLSGGRLPPSVFAASRVRWFLIGAWVVLAANNLQKVPPPLGFDVQAHSDYITYVRQTWSIPFATDGWQMFQSPLYYFVSAALYEVLLIFLDFNTAWIFLRLIPLACGIAQVELCYRAVRSVFPGRDDLQCLGTLVGGLMPMNLYISQYIGNEPFAALFTSLVLVLALDALQHPDRLASPMRQCLMGAALGCAVLSKVTPVLLLPPIVVTLVVGLRKSGSSGRAVCLGVCRFGIVFLGVCGWYYVRNWLQLGRPFVGGWDPARGFVWWQDPGYRILEDFTSLGESLVSPAFSSRFGLWDGLYSTTFFDGYLSGAKPDFVPWNVSLILCLPLLSLAPVVAILLGGAATLSASVVNRASSGLLLAVACTAIYLAAITYMFVSVPVYCIAKGAYALGILPCYAVLAAKGFDVLSVRPMARTAIFAAMTCWAVYAYLGFFVR